MPRVNLLQQLYEDGLRQPFSPPRPLQSGPLTAQVCPLLFRDVPHIDCTAECFADERQVLTQGEMRRLCEMGVKGLNILSHLHQNFPVTNDESTVHLLTCLASYTDLSDRWTSLEARNLSQALLEDYEKSERLPAILTDLLKERVKPLFAKSKNPAITPQGRKAIDPLPNNDFAHSDLDAVAKPWKYRDVYIITVFQWIVGQVDVRLIQMNGLST